VREEQDSAVLIATSVPCVIDEQGIFGASSRFAYRFENFVRRCGICHDAAVFGRQTPNFRITQNGTKLANIGEDRRCCLHVTI